MPTTSFAFTDSHVLETGPFSNFFAYRQFGGVNAQVDFIATGTALTMAYQGNGGATPALQVIVDGSSSTPAMTGDNTDRVLTIFTGLSEGDHRVTIKSVTGNAIYAANAATATFNLTGAAPAFKAPSTAATGQFDLSGTSYVVNGQAGVNVNQAMAAVSFAGASQYRAQWPGGYVRFRASPAGAWKIQGYSGASGRRLRVSVDGVLQTAVVQSSSGNWEYNTLATGTGDGTEKEFAVWFADSNDSAVTYIYSVHLVGMSLNAAYSWPARDTWAWYGDSITANQNNSPADSTVGYVWQVCQTRNKTPENRGIGGSTVHSSGVSRTADITGLSPAPTKCVVLYGSNDAASGGSVTTAQYQADYQSMMHSLCLGLPSCHFYCLYIIPRQSIDVASYNAKIPLAVAALTVGEQAQITIVDTSTWGLAPGGDYTTYYLDGVHPNTAGSTLMANEFLSYVLADTFQRRRPGRPRTGTRSIPALVGGI